MPTTRPPARLPAVVALASLVFLAGCEHRGGCSGDYCGTLVIASAGEPDILLPPVSPASVTRDVTDQLFLKLADLGLSGNTIGDEDFQPRLAERWEWDGPVTLVFHVDPRARWQDGRAVTAADVVFTYDVYTDSLVSSPFRSSLRLISAVTARDSLTAVFRFRERYRVSSPPPGGARRSGPRARPPRRGGAPGRGRGAGGAAPGCGGGGGGG